MAESSGNASFERESSRDGGKSPSMDEPYFVPRGESVEPGNHSLTDQRNVSSVSFPLGREKSGTVSPQTTHAAGGNSPYSPTVDTTGSSGTFEKRRPSDSLQQQTQPSQTFGEDVTIDQLAPGATLSLSQHTDSSDDDSDGSLSATVGALGTPQSTPLNGETTTNHGHGASYVSTLQEDISKVMLKMKLTTSTELINVIKLYRREIDMHHLETHGAKLQRTRSDMRGAMSIRAAQSVGPGMAGQASELLAQDSRENWSTGIFSFRQLASWKLALQRDRERDEIRRRADLRERHEDSIFSEIPLEKDDYAEDRFESDKYVTAEQLKEDTLIRRIKRFERPLQMLVTVLMIYEILSLIFRCFFEIPRDDTSYSVELVFVEVPIMLYALGNIFSLQEENGIVRVDFKAGAKKYLLSHQSVLDFIGIFPLEAIGRAQGFTCTDYVRKCGFVVPYWHMNKLLLCRNCSTMMDSLLDEVAFALAIHPSIGRVITTFLNLSVFAHTASCILNFMVASDQPLSSSWIGDPKYFNRTTADKYSQAMDWATKSIIGYTKGDPFDNPDKCTLFTLFVTLIGLVFVSAFIGSISAYLSKSSAFSKTTQKIDELLDEAHHRKFPQEFVEQAVQYHWHTYESARHSDNAVEALEGLPKHLQIKILQRIGDQLVSRVPLLAPYAEDSKFVMCLAVSLVPVVLMPYTVYFKKGERGNSMAFITWGSMGVVPIDFTSNPDMNTVIFKLRRGMFFGEIALILGVRRTATIASLDHYTNLMELRKDNFLQIAQDFPEVIDQMQAEATGRVKELNDRTEGNRKQRLDALLQATDMVRIYNAFHSWLTFMRQRTKKIHALTISRITGIIEAKRKAPMLARRLAESTRNGMSLGVSQMDGMLESIDFCDSVSEPGEDSPAERGLQSLNGSYQQANRSQVYARHGDSLVFKLPKRRRSSAANQDDPSGIEEIREMHQTLPGGVPDANSPQKPPIRRAGKPPAYPPIPEPTTTTENRRMSLTAASGHTLNGSGHEMEEVIESV